MPGAVGATLLLDSSMILPGLEAVWPTLCPHSELHHFRQAWQQRLDNPHGANCWKPSSSFQNPNLVDLIAGVGILCRPASKFNCLHNISTLLMAQIGNLLTSNLMQLCTIQAQDFRIIVKVWSGPGTLN